MRRFDESMDGVIKLEKAINAVRNLFGLISQQLGQPFPYKDKVMYLS